MKNLFKIIFPVALVVLLTSSFGSVTQAAGLTNGSDCGADTECASNYCDPNPNSPTVATCIAQPTATNPGGQSTTGGGFVPLAPIPGLTDSKTVNGSVTGNTLATFLNNLYKYLIGLAAIIAVIEIIRGGLEISTQESISKHGEGRQHIQQAILGLVLVLAPVLVFSIINPSILNLSLNLPALTTATGNPTSSPTPPASSTDPSGCTTVTGTLFKQATCPNQDSAKKFASACTSGSGQILSCSKQNADGSCADAIYHATCDTASPKYEFVDISSSGFSFWGVVNAITGYSHYQPVGQSPSNPNNGNAAVQFSNTCAADGASTCFNDSNTFVSVPCTYTTPQDTSQSNKCYNITLTCRSAGVVASVFGCSTNPGFTVVP